MNEICFPKLVYHQYCIEVSSLILEGQKGLGKSRARRAEFASDVERDETASRASLWEKHSLQQ
jgi:hypothetical protein